jgi:hypothetical protein
LQAEISGLRTTSRRPRSSLEHGRAFPNRRANAGPDQNFDDCEIILGKVRPFTSPSQPMPRVPCRCCAGGMSRSTRRRCYPSDPTDAEWAVIEPLMPAPGRLASRGGSPGSYCRRGIVDAIRYLVHDGCV